MGRNVKYVEFLKNLQELLQLRPSELAMALGKQTTNLTQYLNGTKKPGKSVVRTGLRQLSEWNVTPILEVQGIPDPMTSIPGDPGIYALYDSAGNTLYAGQANNLRKEIIQTLNRKVNFPIRSGPVLSKKKYPKYKDVASQVSAYVIQSRRLRHNLEALLLRVFANQSHNNKLGNFK